jgi:F-type H+-transporting ATPase subunit delta
MAENDRLELLPEVSRLFVALREQVEKRLTVRVVSALALEADQAERLGAALAKRFAREIELHNEVDPALLGGAVVYAGDQVIDGSVRGRLTRLESSLA